MISIDDQNIGLKLISFDLLHYFHQVSHISIQLYQQSISHFEVHPFLLLELYHLHAKDGNDLVDHSQSEFLPLVDCQQ